MLKSFYKIGELEVEKSDYTTNEKLLMSKTINPVMNSHEKDKTYYEVIMDLDEKKNEISIKLGEELSKENREKFYAFKSSRRGKRILFSTNNIYYFLTTIPDLIDYYKKEKKKLVNESNNISLEKFIDYLINLRDTFYNKDKILMADKFENSQRKKIKEKLGLLDNKKNYRKNLRKAIDEFVSEDILGGIKLKDISVFTLTLNGKRIQNTEYSKEYNYILEYNQFYRDLIKEKYNNKTCSCCGEFTEITSKVEFPNMLKLYVNTGKNFFYGRSENKKRRYRHFSLCEDCLANTYIGATKIINSWKFDFLGDYELRYFLVPKSLQSNDNLEERIEFLGNSLENSLGFYKQIENLVDLKEEAYENDLLLDFVFFTPNSQGTGISLEQTFTNISYSRIIDLINSLEEINDMHYEIGRRSNRKVYFNFPYENIFKTKEGRKYNVIKKELLSFYKALLNEGVISYRFILQRFLRMFKWKIKNKSTKEFEIWRAYDMQLFITWLSKVCTLEGGFELSNQDKAYFKIEYPKINEYFKIHNKTYENKNRQGLFFLGLLINEVLREQSDKNNNFMKKIKYEGMKNRDINKLVNQVTDYLNIYRPNVGDKRVSLLKLNRKVHGLMMDRLQDLESSKLTKDENLFYILSGISFAKNVNYKKIEEGIND